VLAVKRTPVYDPFDDQDDPNREQPPNVRRISTTPTAAQIARRGEVRPLRTPTRRVPPRSGPDPRVWFIRGSIGVAALAGLWLGLQALFPVTESRMTQAPTPPQTQVIDANAVGAPEPPAAPPVAAQPQPTAVPQVAPAQEGDRLPGLPTPDPAAVAQAQPAVAAPAQPPTQEQAATEQPQTQPTPIQPPAPEPTAQPAPAQPPTEPAAAQPAAEAKPQDEAPAQQPVGTPTLEPIPPPPAQQANAAPPAAAQQPAPAPKPQQSAPAPKPQAPAAPPPAAASGGAFELSASASPANPISEQAVVTISVRATQGGAPLAGATCMASIHYRTATAKQPNGGFRTNANGVGSFTLDARNTTYGYYIPVDVTCSGRGGTASARTGFTPVKGR
jgi:hypothetical protein